MFHCSRRVSEVYISLQKKVHTNIGKERGGETKLELWNKERDRATSRERERE